MIISVVCRYKVPGLVTGLPAHAQQTEWSYVAFICDLTHLLPICMAQLYRRLKVRHPPRGRASQCTVIDHPHLVSSRCYPSSLRLSCSRLLVITNVPFIILFQHGQKIYHPTLLHPARCHVTSEAVWPISYSKPPL